MMKSVIRGVCMMALVVLAFTACNKNEQNEQNEPEKTTFTASTQQLEYEGEDRVYITTGSNRILFEPGDMCMLYNINEREPWRSNCATYEAVQEGDVVEFRNCGLGEVALERQDAFYAVYPGGPGCTQTELSSGENKSRFYISPNQEYRQDMVSLQNMYMIGKVDDVDDLGDVHFHFKNIFGVLDLRPYEAARRTVTEIKIVDNYYDLSGWVEASLPYLDWDEFVYLFNNYDLNNPDYLERLEAFKNLIGYNVYDTGNTITMNVPGGVQLGDSRSNTPTFNIVLRPWALYQGFHMIFTFDDGTQKDVDLSGYHNLIMKPNVVQHISMNLDGY